jgi:hypothetical protein
MLARVTPQLCWKTLAAEHPAAFPRNHAHQFQKCHANFDIVKAHALFAAYQIYHDQGVQMD